jgi:peptidyl-prolyl cis-trans isomerase A (cyclophilin A)
MKKIMTAILLASFTACSPEPSPPPLKKAPEPPPVAKKTETPVAKPAPPTLPPPPPPPAEKKPAAPAAETPKVLLDPTLPEWSQTAPAEFKVKWTTSKGDFTMLVMREWSPRGADRFYCLVKNGYYDNVKFFRVVSGFMAQFGIHGDPNVNKVWRERSIEDDPVVQSNTRGMVTFAKKNSPNTRTTQIFINYDDRNSRLDGMKFSPFGKVIEGMDVVDKLYNGYGERGPDQMRFQAEGNAYPDADFKELDYVKTARIVQ